MRVVDVFVDELDLASLGFERVQAASTGRPGYHAGSMLKLLTEFDTTGFKGQTPRLWDAIYKEGKDLLMNLLDIEVPVIAAINGPALIHAEIPLMSDIVLAVEEAEFADCAHMPSNVPPADGVHVWWEMLLGPSRARYFLLTSQRIGAAEAQRLLRARKRAAGAAARAGAGTGRRPRLQVAVDPALCARRPDAESEAAHARRPRIRPGAGGLGRGRADVRQPRSGGPVKLHATPPRSPSRRRGAPGGAEARWPSI